MSEHPSYQLSRLRMNGGRERAGPGQAASKGQRRFRNGPVATGPSAHRAARLLEELHLKASERALVDVNRAMALGVGPDRIEGFLRCERPQDGSMRVCATLKNQRATSQRPPTTVLARALARSSGFCMATTSRPFFGR